MAGKGEPITIAFTTRCLPFEYYGEGGSEVYYKARRPEGGTYELHVFDFSYFDDHPCFGETMEEHRAHQDEDPQ